ncbi:MAG: DUF1570 domain-containing protein [Pirellulaceae bacterium]|nr:DUF1570 domain-containing protein [Planctomycetales bacterium]
MRHETDPFGAERPLVVRGRRQFGSLRTWVTTVLLAVLIVQPAGAAQPWTLRVAVGGQQLVGSPLVWGKSQAILLGRDGQLYEFDTHDAGSREKLSDTFAGYSQSEMRAALVREFGERYEVSATGHYLVVHPAGQSSVWPERFEKLYRSMTHYFQTRGIRAEQPQFPLVAVVFSRHDEFMRYAHNQGSRISSNVLGYYDNMSNRIKMYDASSTRASAQNWETNAATIVHEAAHQTAFNTGVHSRYSLPPRWLAEGLGTLFEAPGIYDSRRYGTLTDRINQQELATVRTYFPKEIPSDALAAIIVDDKTFNRNPSSSYALCWALTFMLAEREPHKLARYLQVTASRSVFKPYTVQQRATDYRQVFGEDIRMTSARLHRFIAELP